MPKLLVSTLPTLDGYDEAKDRTLGVIIDCFHADGDGGEPVDASLASAMAGSRYLPPRVASSTRREQCFYRRVLDGRCWFLAHALQATAGTAEQRNPTHHKQRRTTMTHPPIVSREEWLVARQALLLKAKEATHARDRLNANGAELGKT